MILRDGWSGDQTIAALNWLRRENARGAHIFVRPHGVHRLSLTDDLSADAIAGMKEIGFWPALVVETSPQNFQVWLNHGRILSDHTFSTQAAKELARRFEGDPSSADWRHFWSACGLHESEAEEALAERPPTVRTIASMRGAHLHRGARISRGSGIPRTQSWRAKLGADDISNNFDRRLGPTPR
jgi:hypothetical protein